MSTVYRTPEIPQFDPTGKAKIHNAKWNPINYPIYNAKVCEIKKRQRVAYEQETLGDEVDLSDAAQEEAGNLAIQVIKQKIETYTEKYKKGFMLFIFGTSTGSFTIEHEGKMQLTGCGYQTPPVVDAGDKVIAGGLQGSYGPGGVSVYDCGSSKELSMAVEEAAQAYFTPICDALGSMMPRTWRRIGAGGPKGTGPYHVCIRVMPLPLPHGWHRSF